MSESTFASGAGGLASGQVVAGRYEVVGANRQGGLSVAFEVTDRETDEHLEMQLFPGALFEDQEQVQEFAASWDDWKRIDSPVVLGVRGILAVESIGLVLVTELPRGEVLRDRLSREGRLAPADAVHLGLQLLSGLDEVHRRGLVHGDVKPNTVFVDGEGEDATVRLADGGITAGLWMAKDLGDKTALIGTPYYAPAEQFGGESPDVQSDLYNVATLLFELVAGRLPWTGKNFLEVFQAKIAPTPPSLAEAARAAGVEVSAELDRAIAGGLLADPNARWASAEEFAERLRAAVGA